MSDFVCWYIAMLALYMHHNLCHYIFYSITIYDVEDFLALQKDVNSLANWINVHHLTLKVRKCKSLLVSRKHSHLSGQPVQILGQVLEKAQSYKYLGVLINSNLT